MADVFFSIQIMAGQNKIPVSELKQKYNGSLEIVERVKDGWYRYSVGKFKSLQAAKEGMNTEGIKGYIVAYKGMERISVKDAVNIIK